MVRSQTCQIHTPPTVDRSSSLRWPEIIMKTTSHLAIATLCLLSTGFLRAEKPERNIIEDGNYFLATVEDATDGAPDSFPVSTTVTIKANKEGVPIMQFTDPESDPTLKNIEILLSSNGLLFQYLQKKNTVFSSVYTASTLNGRILGRFFVINGSGGMARQGKFTLEKQK